MKIIPSPGVALVKPVEDKSEYLITGQEQKRIIKGEIVEMGADDTNNYGATVKADSYGKKGDTIHFLSYYQEGGYDQIKLDGELHYYVKFGDFRGTIDA